MAVYRYAALALLALRAVGVFAAEEVCHRPLKALYSFKILTLSSTGRRTRRYSCANSKPRRLGICILPICGSLWRKAD
jgi:hypothetical protein